MNLAALGSSMMSITCKCGHEADYMDFKKTAVTGTLPAGHYQCPACSRAWQVRRGPPAKGWSGCILPGKTIIEPIQQSL